MIDTSESEFGNHVLECVINKIDLNASPSILLIECLIEGLLILFLALLDLIIVVLQFIDQQRLSTLAGYSQSFHFNYFFLTPPTRN